MNWHGTCWKKKADHKLKYNFGPWISSTDLYLCLQPVLDCLDSCGFVVSFESKKHLYPCCVLPHDYFGYLQVAWVYINSRISFSISMKKPTRILIRIMLNLCISLESITINSCIYMEYCSIYWHVLWIFLRECKFCIHFIEYIPKYFFLCYLLTGWFFNFLVGQSV